MAFSGGVLGWRRWLLPALARDQMAGAPPVRHGDAGSNTVLRLAEPEWMDAEFLRWAAVHGSSSGGPAAGNGRQTATDEGED